jgi:hypothetical protein
MTFSIIKQIVHVHDVVEGNTKKFHASVDNGFHGVKIFDITLNYMSYLYNNNFYTREPSIKILQSWSNYLRPTREYFTRMDYGYVTIVD